MKKKIINKLHETYSPLRIQSSNIKPDHISQNIKFLCWCKLSVGRRFSLTIRFVFVNILFFRVINNYFRLNSYKFKFLKHFLFRKENELTEKLISRYYYIIKRQTCYFSEDSRPWSLKKFQFLVLW